MKFDRFLAALFSRKSIAVILLVVIAVFCLTACSFTWEDVFCFALTGCVTADTCSDMIWACGDCSKCSFGFEGCEINVGSCVGDSYNSCFGCVWEGGLKDCRPSTICSKCESNEEDLEYESAPKTCDDCVLDCLDCIVN
ncbi:MAG: hypothetical protein IJY18_01100 [Clostridia bacterium]|nr:hypothetical protein [Clostridia bacterium]